MVAGDGGVVNSAQRDAAKIKVALVGSGVDDVEWNRSLELQRCCSASSVVALLEFKRSWTWWRGQTRAHLIGIEVAAAVLFGPRRGRELRTCWSRGQCQNSVFGCVECSGGSRGLGSVCASRNRLATAAAEAATVNSIDGSLEAIASVSRSK